MRNEERPLLLHAQGVSKGFPGVKALEDMHLELRRGEVLAVVGGNGAGESSPMKLVSGIYSLDEGAFFLSERRLDARARQLIERLRLPLAPKELVGDLIVAKQQMVEIGAAHGGAAPRPGAASVRRRARPANLP
jgi:ribose transport system ATP-binding protein